MLVSKFYFHFDFDKIIMKFTTFGKCLVTNFKMIIYVVVLEYKYFNLGKSKMLFDIK